MHMYAYLMRLMTFDWVISICVLVHYHVYLVLQGIIEIADDFLFVFNVSNYIFI